MKADLSKVWQRLDKLDESLNESRKRQWIKSYRNIADATDIYDENERL